MQWGQRVESGGGRDPLQRERKAQPRVVEGRRVRNQVRGLMTPFFICCGSSSKPRRSNACCTWPVWQQRRGRQSARTWFRTRAFIDPLLTLSVPAAVTAATGLDALTHCIEAFANKVAHPAVDALRAARHPAHSGEISNAASATARTARRAANWHSEVFTAGFCLGPVNTAAVHALSYPLGGRFHITHGVSNAVLLPNVLRFQSAGRPGALRGEYLWRWGGAQWFGGGHCQQRPGSSLATFPVVRCGPSGFRSLASRRDAIPWMTKTAMQGNGFEK